MPKTTRTPRGAGKDRPDGALARLLAGASGAAACAEIGEPGGISTVYRHLAASTTDKRGSWISPALALALVRHFEPDQSRHEATLAGILEEIVQRKAAHASFTGRASLEIEIDPTKGAPYGAIAAHLLALDPTP